MTADQLDNPTVADLYHRIGAVEGKLDTVVHALPKLQDRVDSLEKFKAKALGGVAVISLAVSVFWQQLKEMCGR